MSGALSQTAEAETATRAILLVFRLNGLLLGAGDELAGEQGLTASRWQVLGAIALAQAPPTVPQIARRMGLTRQSVHATVKRLAADGLVQLEPNADHQRSQLVRLTETGAATYEALTERQIAWSNHLAEGIDPAALETTVHTLTELSRRLEYETHQEDEEERK
jgi:DNA-binding MarR family transcriptional regulator